MQLYLGENVNLRDEAVSYLCIQLKHLLTTISQAYISINCSYDVKTLQLMHNYVCVYMNSYIAPYNNLTKVLN